MNILVVDDDRAVRESLGRALRFEGYCVDFAASGREALERVAVGAPSALVLDVRMPGMSGLDVCRALRADRSRLPVLLLTARDAVSDRVAGLDAGADDYLVKPFALDELLARLRALLRRLDPGDETTVRFGHVVLDTVTYEVRSDGRVIELTRTEFNLLHLFLMHPRQVLTRDIIYRRVWGYDAPLGSNSLDVYIGYLRRKTEAGGARRLIHTVRGVGYVLREP